MNRSSPVAGEDTAAEAIGEAAEAIGEAEEVIEAAAVAIEQVVEGARIAAEAAHRDHRSAGLVEGVMAAPAQAGETGRTMAGAVIAPVMAEGVIGRVPALAIGQEEVVLPGPDMEAEAARERVVRIDRALEAETGPAEEQTAREAAAAIDLDWEEGIVQESAVGTDRELVGAIVQASEADTAPVVVIARELAAEAEVALGSEEVTDRESVVVTVPEAEGIDREAEDTVLDMAVIAPDRAAATSTILISTTAGGTVSGVAASGDRESAGDSGSAPAFATGCGADSGIVDGSLLRPSGESERGDWARSSTTPGLQSTTIRTS